MKPYETPAAELVLLQVLDIIAASNDGSDNGLDDEDWL